MRCADTTLRCDESSTTTRRPRKRRARWAGEASVWAHGGRERRKTTGTRTGRDGQARGDVPGHLLAVDDGHPDFLERDGALCTGGRRIRRPCVETDVLGVRRRAQMGPVISLECCWPRGSFQAGGR